MAREYDELRVLVAELYENETRGGLLCPFCNGGRSRERTLSVTRLPDGDALYICHRASCTRKGRIFTGGSSGVHENPKPKPEFTPRLYDASGDVDAYEGYQITGSEAAYEVIEWLGRFGIEASRAPCRWNTAHTRTVWEVRSPLGTLRGYELRAYRDDHKPKTLHYRHTAEPWVGYFRGADTGRVGKERHSGLVVAVEDVVSAYKVGLAGFHACSLMGTNLNLDKLLDILSVSDVIVLALDRDATEKAVGFSMRYSLLAPGIKVLRLERDLKYENPATIRDLIGECCAD